MAKFSIHIPKPITLPIRLREFIFEVKAKATQSAMLISCGTAQAEIAEKTLGYFDPFQLGNMDNLNIE